jgi:thioredoxin-related protein
VRRNTLIFCSLFVLSTTLFSQSPAWFTSSSEAKAYALKNNVPILLVFAGSDWCKPCMMLKADILQSEEFKQYYPSELTILYLDFPMQSKNKLSPEFTKQNELLAGKYNKSGFFPNLVMIDTQGKILGSLTYKHQTSSAFINECKSLIATVKK